MELVFDPEVHVVCSRRLHLTPTTNRRYGLLTDERSRLIREVINGFREMDGFELSNLSGKSGCVHNHSGLKSTTFREKFINIVMDAIACRLRNEFEIKLKTEWIGDSFWDGERCLISRGQISLDVLKLHVIDSWER